METKTKHQIICQGCGVTFYRSRKSTRFCSVDCANKHPTLKRTDLLICTCQQCKKEFIPKVRERNKYCSRECAFAHKKAKPKIKPLLTCVICGRQFEGWGGRKYCSRQCVLEKEKQRSQTFEKAHYHPHTIICKECGGKFITEYGNKHRYFCSVKCSRANYQRLHPELKREREHRRRARLHGATHERVDIKAVYERDNWSCQICHKPVNKKLRYPNPMSASLDHIVSVARGGSHESKNCQLAHWICNSRKRDLPQGQLMLIG